MSAEHELATTIVTLERTIIESRLQALASMLLADRAQRLARLEGVLTRLPPGAYLLGTGPSTVGLVPLSVDEIVLGRAATSVEEPADRVVDVEVRDTLYFTPNEVSRVHARILRARSPAGEEIARLEDLGSTCGTFLQGEPVPPGPPGRALHPGETIALGRSGVSTFLYWVKAAT